MPTAPNLYEVTQASDTTVRLRWAFAGLANLRRFVIEQQDDLGSYQHLANLRAPSAREWTGTPPHAGHLQPLPHSRLQHR
ncbi:MAG: hypothetical protein GW893_20005 [Armatimonadetes bacterium]|nr:hypothetical protein [Armatimonadota bacterium]PIX44181.1 MAG: hypothetical protein COZ56_05185 [Armatimonadetes bacterium CG_4_8_14_3_um_filter_58_9]